MDKGLSLLSESELDSLRSHVEQAMRTGTLDHRLAAGARLETIDLELERRLSSASRLVP